MKALHFVWEIAKIKKPKNTKKLTVTFRNKNITWYIGKDKDLKKEFPDTECTEFEFCNPSIPIIVMKSKNTNTSILEMKAFIGKAFNEAKKQKVDLSAYEEWLIYEKNMLNDKIKCEQCGTVNECDKDMSFDHYCKGQMKWKEKEVQCWGTFHFAEHSYKLRDYDFEEIKKLCFEGINNGQCDIIACCNMGHKEHDFIIDNKESPNDISWFKKTHSCINCGTIKLGLNENKTWEELEDKLFKLFVEQYSIYWKQYNSDNRSESKAKALTRGQREIHSEIKSIIRSDMMVVQRALDYAESNIKEEFSDIVFGIKDRKEALAKIYDYADLSTKYILDRELKGDRL